MDMDPEVRKKQVETGLKWAGGLAGVIAFGFVLPYILSGVLGLAALAIAGVVGWTALQLWPVYSMKVANWNMKGIIAEARENPIETLHNDYKDQEVAIDQAVQVTIDWETELANYDDEIKRLSKDAPDEAESCNTISDMMHEGLGLAKEEIKNRRLDLAAYAKEIRTAEAKYKMGLATQKIARFDQAAADRVWQSIKRNTAIDSVRDNLHRGVAQMKASLEKRSTAQLTSKPLDVIPTRPHLVAKEPAPFPQDRVKEG